MPWCPNCKTEYREGFTTCIDCNIELMDELKEIDDYEEVISLKEEATAKKLVEFLAYSNITSYFKYSDVNKAFTVYTHQADLKKAEKCFKAFYAVELENASNESDDDSIDFSDEPNPESNDGIISSNEDNETDEDEDENVAHSSAVYVKKSEQYKELKSTAATFLFFGFGGLLFMLLNVLGVVSFFQGPFPHIVMTVMFLGFLYIGFSSIKSSKKAAADAILEEELTARINAWLDQNVTDKLIKELQDESVSHEVNYIKTIDSLKAMLTKELGEMDDSYLDSVLEEFYSNRFE